MSGGRIRTVKPEILEDAVTAGLSDTAFRLFIAVIVLSDDYGRFRAEPGWLRGQVYWSRDLPMATFMTAMAELEPLVEVYLVNGQRYGAVRNWSKHQKVDKPGKPRIPGPPETLDEPPETLARVSRDVREGLAPDQGSGIRDQGSGIVGSGPVSGPSRESETDTQTTTKPKPERPSGVRKAARVAKPRHEPETHIPPDFSVSPELEAICRRENLPNPHDVLRDFRDWAEDKQVRKARWEATFRRWMRSKITAERYRPWNETDPVRAAVEPRVELTPEQIERRRRSSEITRAAIAEMRAREANHGTGAE